MTIAQWLLVIFIIGFIASGILILKQTAKKFNLTDEQKKAVQARQKQQAEKDKETKQ